MVIYQNKVLMIFIKTWTCCGGLRGIGISKECCGPCR